MVRSVPEKIKGLSRPPPRLGAIYDHPKPEADVETQYVAIFFSMGLREDDESLATLRALIQRDQPVLCMRGVLFLTGSHRSQHEAIRTKIETLVRAAGTDSFEVFYDLAGEQQELDEDTFSALMDVWFEGSLSEAESANIHIGRDDFSPTPYGLSYVGVSPTDLLSRRRGALSFWVPLDVSSALMDEGPFEGFFSGCSVSSGHISPSVLCRRQAVRQRLASEFQTLDISDPHEEAYSIGDKISGVHHITYLTREGYVLLGQEELDRSMREAGAEVLPCGKEGMVVQMPRRLPYPWRASSMMPYARLARRIKAANLWSPPGAHTYFQDEIGVPAHLAQAAWHDRFLADATETPDIPF